MDASLSSESASMKTTSSIQRVRPHPDPKRTLRRATRKEDSGIGRENGIREERGAEENARGRVCSRGEGLAVEPSLFATYLHTQSRVPKFLAQQLVHHLMTTLWRLQGKIDITTVFLVDTFIASSSQKCLDRFLYRFGDLFLNALEDQRLPCRGVPVILCSVLCRAIRVPPRFLSELMRLCRRSSTQPSSHLSREEAFQLFYLISRVIFPSKQSSTKRVSLENRDMDMNEINPSPGIQETISNHVRKDSSDDASTPGRIESRSLRRNLPPISENRSLDENRTPLKNPSHVPLPNIMNVEDGTIQTGGRREDQYRLQKGDENEFSFERDDWNTPTRSPANVHSNAVTLMYSSPNLEDGDQNQRVDLSSPLHFSPSEESPTPFQSTPSSSFQETDRHSKKLHQSVGGISTGDSETLEIIETQISKKTEKVGKKECCIIL